MSPYTKAALMLGYHEDEGHVEEGYAEFMHFLPGKWETKIGKFLVPVGILNPIHSHDWPIVAKPLPLKFFFGDEHGWSENALSLNTPIVMTGKQYLHFDAQILNGDSAILFNNGQTKVYGGKIYSNLNFDDKSDLNLSLSYYDGSWNKAGDLYSKLYTASMMYRYRFSQFNRFTLWAEWLHNKREQLNLADFNSKGYYISAMYKFKKGYSWHFGLEYDCTEKPTDARFNAIAKSIFAGFWFTENDRLQLQYRKVRDPFIGENYNELLFQIIWGFGPHKPHLANF